ncbi:NAD(P)-dependent oxidoreductase [Xenorhabdus koppenhoeferi]|uniref:D-isomer specific 2-hydroxyacid dehydrogenase, NAD binding domain n=1 Tax=Xenorhabdus koppenhoeferi TaxID=351659 RepID=A0A1I7JTZ6_9GAMM|nr:NAD(P)-dependent oxidoreductase [Xenorhabdus koppenhoeferi]SFU88635.1 D-isomer specific 2-hydroxyacid dehydrogenase, NAD binding domain [Xenorhabdus koppenhoeferi]
MKSTHNPTLLLTGCSLTKGQYYRYGEKYARIIELPQPLSKSAILAQGFCVTDYILGGPEYIDDTAFKHFPKFAADHVREGSNWPQQAWKTLHEQCTGIFGMGHIGQALVEKLYALGARQLTYTSRSRKPQLEQQYGLHFVSQKQLFNECDSVSLHLSYNEQTHHLINQSALQKCNPCLRLLCFSNPHVIDPKAARAALLKGNLQQLYTLRLSNCLFVGCARSPRSHNYLCSRGFALLPSRCNLRSIVYI